MFELVEMFVFPPCSLVEMFVFPPCSLVEMFVFLPCGYYCDRATAFPTRELFNIFFTITPTHKKS
jgi:hypothetical protein